MKKKALVCLAAVSTLVAVNICAGFKLGQPKAEAAKYCGGSDFIDQSETINYATKETTSYAIKSEVPNYYGSYNGTSCANLAGAIIIGYYDRFCEELIPNYKAYVQIGSGIRYRTSSIETATLTQQLHTLMDSDVGGAGTTYQGFQNGMNSYVSNCGYSYSIIDLGALNLNSYKAEVELNRPVAIFLSNFSMKDTCEDSGTSEVINSCRCYSAHVVIGFGYKIDTYYNSNGQVITTRTYLKVASGLFEFKIGYLCLDGKSSIDKATSAIIQ